MQSFIYDNYKNFANSIVGGISSVKIVDTGSSYSNTDTISIVRDSNDLLTSNAVLTLVTTPAGSLSSIDIVDGGEYTITPIISITSNSGSGASLSPRLSSDQWYLFCGHSTPWANEYSPDPVSTSIDGSFYTPYQQMFSGIKILPGDVTPIIPNIQWQSGVTYSQYDDQSQSTLNTYVVTTGGNVFKCLNNAQNSPSTVQPTLPSAGNFSPPFLSDGYQWIYMYNIQTSVADVNYVPVDDVSTGFVSMPNSAYGSSGAIYNVSVDNAGSGYYHSSGSVLSVSDFVVTLSDNPTQYRSIYKGYYLTVFGAQNEVNNYVVSDSFAGGNNLSVRIASSSQISANTLASGYSYVLSPAIAVTGDGTGFLGYATVDSVSNSIASISVINPGANYSFANAFVSSTTLGSIAELRPIISPPGGHGSDPVRELNCKAFCIQSKLPDMSPTLPSFRQIGLLKNPIGFSGEQYGSFQFNQLEVLTFSPAALFCVVGETLISQDGKSLLTVVSVNSPLNQATVSGVRGHLNVTDTLTGAISGCKLVVSNIGTFSGLQLNSGDIDYINNIPPVSVKTPTVSIIVS